MCTFILLIIILVGVCVFQYNGKGMAKFENGLTKDIPLYSNPVYNNKTVNMHDSKILSRDDVDSGFHPNSYIMNTESFSSMGGHDNKRSGDHSNSDIFTYGHNGDIDIDTQVSHERMSFERMKSEKSSRDQCIADIDKNANMRESILTGKESLVSQPLPQNQLMGTGTGFGSMYTVPEYGASRRYGMNDSTPAQDGHAGSETLGNLAFAKHAVPNNHTTGRVRGMGDSVQWNGTDTKGYWASNMY